LPVTVMPAFANASAHACAVLNRSLNVPTITAVLASTTSSATLSPSVIAIGSPETLCSLPVANPARTAAAEANTGRGWSRV